MFAWRKRSQYLDTPTAYCLGYTEVACLFKRVNGGGWRAQLNRHQDEDKRIDRECSSEAAGRLGVELWAERHKDRLVAEVAARDARLRRGGPWAARQDSAEIPHEPPKAAK